MADPTSLKFDIILDDKDFKSKINADIELARKLNESVSKSLNMSNLTQAATQTAAATEKVTTATKETTKAQKSAKDAIEQSARSLTSSSGLTRAWLRFSATMWSVISVVRLFVRTIGSAIKNISDFQQANANLATIMQVSRKEIEVLTNDALMLGRTTEWTASQVTELQTALAKLGYNIPQIRNMQASVLQFATAVGANLPDAANLAGASLRMFGMRSSQMQQALEVLTASTNKTALDFEKLKVSLPYVGAIAHSIGLDIAQTASLLGVLTNAGLESSRAGTGLRQVLLELSKTNGKLQTAMGGNIKTFDDFVNGLQKMRDRGFEAGEAAKLVQSRASAALLILANGVDDIRRLNDEVRDTDGLLKTIQSDRLDTLHGSTLLLKSAWEGLIQTFRDSAGPMKDIVDWLTQIIRATSLAASRANRVAQGTSDVMGSDDITSRFKKRYEQLLEDEKTPEQAAEIVRNEMQKWLNGAFKDLATEQRRGYKETGWTRFLYNNPLTGVFMRNGVMGRGRAANEQVEAVENSMDAMEDYMASRAKEEAQIAAENYLSEWRRVFDAEGAKAARDAMSKVAGYDNIKRQVEEYIASGGANGANDRGKGKETEEEKNRRIINGLKNEARYLEKLKDAFEKLVPYLGEEGAAKKMVEIFGEGEYTEKNIEQGILAITDALDGMGEEGKDAAQSILTSLGMDKLSQFLKAQKAVENQQKAIEKARKELSKWGKEWGGQYRGFDGEIEKALVKYKNDDKKIDEEYNDALWDAYEAYKDDTDALKEYTDELYRYYLIRKKANFDSNATALDDLASKYVKSKTSDMSLKDWGDKSIGQVYTLWQTLKSMGDAAIDGDLKISEGLAKELEESGFSLEDFRKLSYDEFQKLTAEAKEELQKKLGSLIKEVAGDVSSLLSAFSELSEASGNLELADFVEGLDSVINEASTIASRLSHGDIIGAVTSFFSWWIGSIVKANAEAKKFEATLASMREESRKSTLEESLKAGVSSIFGTNDLQKVQNSVDTIGKIRNSMKEYYGEIGSKVFNGRRIRPFEWAEVTGINSHYLAARLSSMAESVGGYLYDAYGNLNAETLQKILESYKNLDSAQKEWLQHAIDDSEAYAEAMKQVEDVAESILGNVVSDVASKMVDSWWEAGEAALDYKDILGDVAKAYAKLIVQDMLMDAAFDGPKREQFINALKSGDASTAMAVVNQAMQSATDMLPTVNAALQAFEPYRNMAQSGTDSSSNSVGAGFKSFTEETASLLASYINAIRADVSYIRVMQEKGWSGITTIGESMPTLNDYLAQCAANTYDVAQSNQSILSEIRSVIGAPGTSGMVVRVEQY